MDRGDAAVHVQQVGRWRHPMTLDVREGGKEEGGAQAAPDLPRFAARPSHALNALMRNYKTDDDGKVTIKDRFLTISTTSCAPPTKRCRRRPRGRPKREEEVNLWRGVKNVDACLTVGGVKRDEHVARAEDGLST